MPYYHTILALFVNHFKNNPQGTKVLYRRLDKRHRDIVAQRSRVRQDH